MKACPVLLILAIAITAIVADAEASEVTLTWIAPTHYTNGEVLPPSHIVDYTVMTVDDSYNTTDTTITVNVEPGFRCFFALTNATNGLSSGIGLPGSYVCKDIPGDGPPGEPVYVCP